MNKIFGAHYTAAMDPSSMFIVVLSIACVIRHVLELAFLTSKTTTDAAVATRCGTHDRKDVVFMHGATLAAYLMAISTSVMNMPHIAFPAIGVTIITDGFLTSWCPPNPKK